MADISAPNQGAYGTYEAALAQMLASQQGPIAGPLNALALQSHARGQRGGYDLALQRTQALQQAEMQRATEAELSKTALQQIAPMATAGVSSAVPMEQFGIEALLPVLQAADAGVVAENEANAIKGRSSAVANMADAGLLPSAAGTAGILYDTPVDPETAALLPYTTPDADNDRIRANAAATSAAASMTSATRPRSSGGGGGGGGSTSYTVVPSAFPGMPPQITIRTKDAGMVEQYMPQSNVVEQSGGARSASEELRNLLRNNRRSSNRD